MECYCVARSVAKCRGSWVVGRGRGSWVVGRGSWVVGVGKFVGKKKSFPKKKNVKFMKQKSPCTYKFYSPSPRSAKQIVQMDTKKPFTRKTKEILYNM